MYWAHGQRSLRVAHDVRRRPGVYSVYCSNYSCGPDSFALHFYAYLMEGKPFAVIETDGHSGDAGTKTRLEAFLHCVGEDRAAKAAAPRRPRSLKVFEEDQAGLADIRRRGERILIPRMGPGAAALAACLRGAGVAAEALPMPDRDTVRAGRRHTSGKECVPMCITAGSLLQRIEREPDREARFAFFMPTANGPCRFGVYHLLHRIILERTGFGERVRIWAPSSANYFDGVPAGFAVLAFTAFMAADLLLEALHHARPVERQPGAADRIHARHEAELYELLERAGAGDLGIPAALLQVATGRLFGVPELLGRAARALAQVADERPMPTVLVVGEIYVRLDPFANDFIVDKLERRGIRARLAPFNEWIEYSDRASLREGEVSGFAAHLSSFVRAQIQARCYAAVADALGWPARTGVADTVRAAAPYLREALVGEALLTIGGPLHEHAEGLIDGAIAVGPLECMPNKLAESQLQHAAEETGVLSLTLPVNGDPVDDAVIDSFAYEVHARFRQRGPARRPAAGLRALRFHPDVGRPRAGGQLI
jgi:predicted nucleotide-binding protein (sugar kinase/HSP70/actin superfamily)